MFNSDLEFGIDNLYPIGYTSTMVEIRKTELFARLVRIERLAAGNAGDVRPIKENISELRIDCGPGYRVYFTRRGREIVILLAGGDKSTQAADIKTAIRLAQQL